MSPGSPRRMIGIPQLSPTPQGDVMVDVPGWLHTVSAIPAELMQPGTEVSHKLWVMPHRGLLSLPTHTSQPSSFIWNGLFAPRSEEHTSELQSQSNLVCRLLLEKKKH